MGSKQTSQANTSSTYSPPPAVMQQYQNVTNQANQVAATPYSAYGGQLVAPVNGQQSTGINAVNAASGIQNGYNAGATGLAAASSTAINPETVNAASIQQYESPYQSDVVNATEAEIQNQNQQQAAGLTGSAISSGAFGGDRAGIAQAALAGQQDIAENATVANLNNQNYSQALGEANTQQTAGMTAQQETNANELAASGQIANIGNTAQTEALNEANAQTNAGTLQQTTQQAADTAAYNQFLQQQAYPFETTGWLANIVEGIGSQSGGSSTGQTTTTGSTSGAVAGGLLGLASFLARGGRVPRRAAGGLVRRHFDDGGGISMPQFEVFNPTSPAGSQGIGGGSVVPQVALPVGHTMPNGQAPNPQAGLTNNQNNINQMSQMAKGVQGLGNSFENSSLGDSFNDAMQDAGDGGGLLGGLASIFARGGSVPHRATGGIASRPHYDDGGDVPIGDVSPELLMPSPDASALSSSPEAVLAAQYANQMPAPSGLVAPAVADTMPAPSMANNGPSPTSFTAPIAAPSPGIAPQGTIPAGLMPQMQLGDIPGSVPQGTAMPSGGISPQGGPIAHAADGTPVATDASGNAIDPATGQPTQGSGIAAPMAITPNGSPASAGVASGVDPSARGIRNNNPGNLESNSWTASLPGYVGSDGRFAIFATPQQGASALDRNLQSYGAKGISTPLQIASTWAPGSEKGNNPASYGGAIASTLGVGLNDPVDMSDPNIRGKIAQAITKVENGGAPSAGIAASTGNGAPPAAPNPDEPAPGAVTAQGIAPERSGLLGLNIPDNIRTGMLAAGLGMMAGTSRSGLVNIGQGGLAGLQAYQQNRTAGAEVGLKQAQAAQMTTETALKQRQLDLMMKGLEQLGEPAKAASNAAPVATAGAGAASGAPTGGVSPAVAPSGAAAVNTAASEPQIDPAWDPNELERKAKIAAFAGLPAAAETYRAQANQILQSGRVRMADGTWGTLPGIAQAEGQLAGAKKSAELAASAPYDLQEVQDTPGGPTTYKTKAQILAGAQSNPNQTIIGPGAGSPPGSAANAVAAANPTVAKQPAFIAKRQEDIATQEGEMLQQFQARQLSRQRLQTLSQIMQTYQPGAFAQQKADFVASLRGVGIPVADSDTANPAAFQEFTKNAVANVFNDVKGMGGRVLVSEINGLTKANANPELQPGAAAAIIGQGLGVLNYEDDHTKSYFAWKQQNPSAYDTSQFELPWAKGHPVSQYVDQATKGIAYQGQDIPPAGKRSTGQTYMTPRGPMTWRGNGWAPAGASP